MRSNRVSRVGVAMSLAALAGWLLAGCAASAEAPADEAPATVALALVGCVEESSEPNNARAAAAAHTFGSTQEGGVCATSGNNDWYRFQGPPAGQVFSIRLEYKSSVATVSATLWDAANNYVNGTPGYGDNGVLTATSNGGIYYLQVSGGPNSYRFVSALGNLPRCPEPDPDEPNDFSGEFKPLPFGSTYEAFNCAGENDYYQFAGPPTGQEFTVNVLFDHEVGDLDFRLSSTTQSLSRSSRNDNETASIISNGGTYTLVVAGPNFSNFFGGSSNSYQVQTVLGYQPVASCAAEDAFEPNDRPLLATPLAGSGEAQAYLCGNLPDYYSIPGPPAGVPLFARLQFAGPVDASVSLVNQLGTTVAAGRVAVTADQSEPAAELLGTISDGGTYQLIVQGMNDAVAQGYSIVLDSTAPPALCSGLEDALEPNDSSFRASSIPYPGSLQGASCSGNVDQYRFQGPPSRVRFEVEVLFSELTGSVEARLINDAGTAQTAIIRSPGRAVFEQVSGGGRYRLTLDPLSGAANRYEVTLREAPRLCSVSAEISALGLACGIANGGPFATAIAGENDSSAPDLSEDVSTNVTLLETPLGNRGIVAFTPSVTGSYAVFTGTPAARMALRGPSGVIQEECLTSLDARECNKLRRVYRYDLVAGVRYLLDVGPAFPQKYVRLGVHRTTVGALECTNPQLPDRGAACVRDLVDAAVQAAALGTDGPSLVEDALTLLQLPSGVNGRAGSVTFTPPLSGAYQLFLSANVPVTFWDGTLETALTCQRALLAADCSAFRRAVTVQLDSRRTYRLDFGPSTASAPRVLLKRVEPAAAALCGATELPDKAEACAIPASSSLPDINASGLSEPGPAPAIESGVASYLHLVAGADGNGGAVSFQPATTGSYQLFLGAPHVPFRIYDGLLQLPPTCTEQLSSLDCQAFRRGTRFELSSDRTYRLEIGPISPSNRVRVLLDSSND